MDQGLAIYLPQDRRLALAEGRELPERVCGAALFADVSGYSRLTEALALALGPWRGAEELTRQLNLVYDALIVVVEAYGGSVVSFSGDAITCWFAEPGNPPEEATPHSAALYAVACGLALQHAMAAFAAVPLPDGSTTAITLKVAVAGGPARRMVVGDPQLQLLDVLAGAAVIRAAEVERLADPGDVLADPLITAALGADLVIDGWRTGLDDTQAAVIAGLHVAVPPQAPSMGAALPEALVRPWLQPAIYERLREWPTAFITELRPAISLFVRFGALDFSAADARLRLDAYIQHAQHALADHGGLLTQLTFGDKGSYFLATFGAPVAHEDDAYRALATALALRRPPAATGITSIQIGLSRGLVRVGTYGGAGRRIYGVMGNEVNLAARLMTAAEPGQILADAGLYARVARAFAAVALPPLTLKGHSKPVDAVVVTEHRTSPALPIRIAPDPATLVGRTDELQQADERLALARRGQGQVICLIGEAGLGKSRLTDEIRRRAEREGLRCLAGGAQPYGQNTPYLAWRTIGRDFFAIDSAASAADQIERLEHMLAALAPALTERLPFLGALLGLALEETELTHGMPARLRKEALQHTVVECLRAGAAAEPLLVIIEDAHWLDPLSLDLIAELAVALADVPIALLLTTRPDDERWRAALPPRTEAHYCEIALGELAASDAEQLALQKLRALFGPQVQFAPGLIAQLNAWAQGNPFYLEELLYYLRDRRQAEDLQTISAIDLPSSLASLILSRIDQLPAPQQRMLKIASITGLSFAVEWLWGVYPTLGPAAQVHHDLATLARLGITPVVVGEARRRYQFRHSLMHEVIYESVPFELRAQLHEQFAAWLETHANELPLDMLAFHYGRSTNRAKQREYFRRAADAAAASFANDTAGHYYEQLLRLIEPADQAEVLLALGGVLDRVGAWNTAQQRFREAAAAAVGRPGLITAALQHLAVVERSMGRYDEAITLLSEARDAYDTLGDAAGWVRASNELGATLWLRGDYAAARTTLEHSLARAEAAADAPGMAKALHILGNVSGVVGDLELSTAQYTRSLALRRQLGDIYGIASSLGNLGLTAFEQGDYDRAEQLVEECHVLFSRLGSRRDIALSLMKRGRIAFVRGDAARARPMFGECLNVFHTIGARWEQTMALVWFAATLADADATSERLRIALTLTAAALHLIESFGGVFQALDQAQAERTLATTQAALTPTEAEAAWATGRAYTWAEATRAALAAG